MASCSWAYEIPIQPYLLGGYVPIGQLYAMLLPLFYDAYTPFTHQTMLFYKYFVKKGHIYYLGQGLIEL